MKKLIVLCLLYILGSAAWAGIPGAQYSTTAGVFTIGTLPISCGGLNLTSTPSNGQVPIGNGSGYVLNTLTAGSGINITNGSGSATISQQLIPSSETTTFSAAFGYLYTVDTSSGAVIATLPDATLTPGGQVAIVWAVRSSGLTIHTTSSQTINTSPPANLQALSAQGQGRLFISDGSNWWMWNLGVIQAGFGGTGTSTGPTNGQVLIGSTSSSSYAAATIGSSDSTITWTLGANTLTGQVNQGNLLLSSLGGSLNLTSQVGSSILPIANGGTDNGSLGVTAGGVIYTDGTKLQNSGAGTSGYPFVSAGSSAPGFALLTGSGIASSVALAGSPTTTTQSSSDNSTKIATTAYVQSALPAPAYGFGGNGADGAIALTGATAYTSPIQKNATTFSLTGANTLTVGTANTPLTGTPTVINCTSTFTLGDATNASTITVATGSGNSGGAGGVINGNNGYGAPGGGPGGGGIEQGTGVGGYGGAFGGTGGSTVSGSATNNKTYFNFLSGGSGGGGGSGNGGTVAGGAGGNGGGSLLICAVGAINCKAVSVINCQGGAGASVSANSAGAGAGGSGGSVVLASQTSVTVTGTINVSGGAAGASSGSGTIGAGGGGSGIIVCWSPSNSTGSATFTVSGGNGGSSSVGNGGAGGSGSEVSITGSPNLPLLGYVNTPEGNSYLGLLAQLGINNIPQRTLANFAGHNTVQGFAYFNIGTFEGSTCINIGDDVSLPVS